MLASDVYNNKFYCISENESLIAAFKMLQENSFNSLLVIKSDGTMSGVLCVQDILKKIVPPEMQANTTLARAMYKPSFFKDRCHLLKESVVKDIMRSDFYCASPDTSVMEIAAELLKSQLTLVPICEDERILGVISRTDMKNIVLKNLNVSSNN